MSKEKLKKIRLLFVDDEKDLQSVIKLSLSNLLHTVDVASNGQEGLAKFLEENNSYDLIVTDINMPTMNGWKMLEKIREVDQDIDVIVTTGDNIPDEYKKFNATIFPKPMTISSLIEHILENH